MPDPARRRLPPLNAIKAFEAVARLGSLSLAARELSVTPGAVSQQLRILGEFFGKRLFVRRHNRLQLTDAGLSVFGDTAEIIDRLSAMTARLLEGEQRAHLVVSALPSVAVRWLNYELGTFLAAAPEVRCELRVEDDPVDFARHHIDLRLSYGEHLYPELVTVPLVRDEVTPLCSPAYLKRVALNGRDPASLPERDLIHMDWGASFASYPTWSQWFAAAGKPRPVGGTRGHKTSMSSLAIDLALSGAGIALGQRLLAQRDLASGALLAPFATSLPLTHPYCLVHAHAKADKRIVVDFVRHLQRALAPTQRV
jgi:LysR family glycine cleavage system transcriptional activator